MPIDITPDTPESLPEGDYAIVEMLGHRTLAGRVTEVERYGTKFLALEPLFQNLMLDAVLIAGGSIYQLTPCSPAAAWSRRGRYRAEVAGGLGAVVNELPALGLPAPSFDDAAIDDDDESEFL